MDRSRRVVSYRGAVAGALLGGVLVAIALLAPWLAGDPIARDVDHGLSALGAPLPPSADALLGTDHLGRDVWARIAAGARYSLWVAALATLLASALGAAVGLTAGLVGGWTDLVLMRLVDLVLAFPVVLVAILLAMLLRESALASSTAPVIVTLAALSWTTTARVVRAKARVLATSAHVAAARALGAGPLRLALRHLAPNLVGILVVLATLGFAQNLMCEAILSYLGLGPPPPEPSWGRMLYEGRVYYRTAPHLVLAPGLAIVLAVVAFHLLGDGLRGALDPKERR